MGERVSVSRDEVRRVARLARLRLDEEEAGSLAGDLSTILDHVEALRAAPVDPADGDDADPLDRPPRVRRPGQGPDTMSREPAELAPRWRDGFFVLPRLPALNRDDGEDR